MKKHFVICSFLSAIIVLISVFAMLPFSAKEDTSRGKNWMKGIDDSTPLTQISIPGSHDSGAFHSIADLSGKCQDMSIKEQLNAGIRFFDIRLQQRENKLKVVHGIVDQKLDFSDMLGDFDAFLKASPKEGLIVSIKEESSSVGSTISFEESLKLALDEHDSFWERGRELPSTLGELRGKICLVSRYKGNTIGIPAYNGWIEHDKGSKANTFDIPDSNLHIQDFFKIYDIEDKQKEIVSCFEYSSNNFDNLTLNFSSCYYLDSFPPTYAGTTAKLINGWLLKEIEGRNNLGVIISDFVTSNLAEAVYKRNFQ